MPYMDKRDLRNKIEQLYSEALEIEDSTLIIGLDAVKSILGTDLNNIDPKLLNWYIEQKPSSDKTIEYDKFDNSTTSCLQSSVLNETNKLSHYMI